SEIAGDFLLAQRSKQIFLQFTKTPFPFVTAQSDAGAWTIEFPLQKVRYGGHGQPPNQIGWFQLAHCLDGAPASGDWTWSSFPNNRWRLENKSTGEIIEGYLNP
ncbi:MAG TPA: hypothetical protein VKA67_07575, partial [Verrucomicrobiae bacterium]|nr:hypothetical protein [Verrucomicrobiae bacterium]